MTAQILIYHDPKTRTHTIGLVESLRSALQSCPVNIGKTDRSNFGNAIRGFNPQIIILPEIIGETSTYAWDISTETQDILRSYVENGGMLVTFCAATYWMAQKILYHPPKGPTKMRTGSACFNAISLKAFGPLAGYWSKSDGKPGNSACRIIPITIKSEQRILQTSIWYGNGPALMPIADQDIPANVKPIAYYDYGTDKETIAACSVQIGKGSVLMSGPLPHYNGADHVGRHVPGDNILWRMFAHRMNQQIERRTDPRLAEGLTYRKAVRAV